MYSWANLSSSSVVTPALALAPTRAIASAAIFPAALIFSTWSALLIWLPVHSAGEGLPTYSGRAMALGTESGLEITPGVRNPVWLSLGIAPVYFEIGVRLLL